MENMRNHRKAIRGQGLECGKNLQCRQNLEFGLRIRLNQRQKARILLIFSVPNSASGAADWFFMGFAFLCH